VVGVLQYIAKKDPLERSLLRPVPVANLSFRFSSFFACAAVKPVGKRKNETVLAHTVGGVHFERRKLGFH